MVVPQNGAIALVVSSKRDRVGGLHPLPWESPSPFARVASNLPHLPPAPVGQRTPSTGRGRARSPSRTEMSGGDVVSAGTPTPREMENPFGNDRAPHPAHRSGVGWGCGLQFSALPPPAFGAGGIPQGLPQQNREKKLSVSPCWEKLSSLSLLTVVN